MAGVKISALPSIPSSQLTDIFPAVQAGVTYKVTNQQLLTLFQSSSGGFVLTNPPSDQTISAHNLTLTSGTYIAPTMLPGNLSLTANTISSTNTNGNVNLIPNGTGLFNVGTSTSLNASLMTLAENSLAASQTIGAFINSASGPTQYFVKSRNTTVGGNTAVQSNDALMTIVSFGSDGTSLIQNAEILVLATGSISTGIVPTEMLFQTMNSSGALVTALTIAPTQVSTFAAQVIAPSFSPNTTSGIIGTTTNDNAAAGSVGQTITSNVAAGSPVTLSNGSAVDITHITLTAGDWDVWGNVVFNPSSGTIITAEAGWINTTSVTAPDGSQQAFAIYGTGFAQAAFSGFVVPSQRIQVASGTQNVYLTVNASFSVSGLGAAGNITARRRR